MRNPVTINNEGEEFIRRQHPDKRTNREWIKVMNRKWDTYWGMRVREKKELRKR